jgi:hypothetical protein
MHRRITRLVLDGVNSDEQRLLFIGLCLRSFQDLYGRGMQPVACVIKLKDKTLVRNN